MEHLNLNKILDREWIVDKMKSILQDIDKTKCNDHQIKKGFYIYGNPGSGKTEFVSSVLKMLGYDAITYDAGDIRNKSIIETIAKHNMSNQNIMSMFEKKVKKIVIVMDEIDGMNNGDKGGITHLIRLIRPKKTKKQKTEESSVNPIICIGNYHTDKKIKELIKVCHAFELKTPTSSQMNEIVTTLMPTLDEELVENIIEFTQGDLRKVTTIYNIYNQDESTCSSGSNEAVRGSGEGGCGGGILNTSIIKMIFEPKTYNENNKQITKKLFDFNYSFYEHNTLLNETDRTTVGLLWHENIIDMISKYKNEDSIRFYKRILDNVCFADYVDRITFQKQIWQFNEMSSLIKTFYNNKLYHEYEPFKKKYKCTLADIRFTKVLTKYSTEYNNSLFIQNLCQQLGMDQKDMITFFYNLKNKYNYNEEEIYDMLHTYDIGKLDVSRMYRYLNKYLGIENIESLSSSTKLKNEFDDNDKNENDAHENDDGE
jgi:DNA polymerase III delta prime subunit